MLGEHITDDCGAEGGGSIAGLGLLPVITSFGEEKHRSRASGRIERLPELEELSGAEVEGYEIHMGKTELKEGARSLVMLDNGSFDGCFCKNVLGSYLHGFFDSASCRAALLTMLCAARGIDARELAWFDYAAYKEQQYDALANGIRENLDMSLIYRILEEGVML